MRRHRLLKRIYRWIDRNILELGREMRISYLPPLMVYMAYGISSLTGIVGTFFVKEYLGLSAEFLFDVPEKQVWSRALRAGGIDPISLVPGGAIN